MSYLNFVTGFHFSGATVLHIMERQLLMSSKCQWPAQFNCDSSIGVSDVVCKQLYREFRCQLSVIILFILVLVLDCMSTCQHLVALLGNCHNCCGTNARTSIFLLAAHQVQNVEFNLDS